jgi:biopolymer transport protein ExbD
MALLKRRSRSAAEIPMASMADIAFLLLIFFLLVTTIDVDTGIGMVLPPPLDEEQTPPEIRERNMLAILVNQRGDVLVRGEPSAVRLIREEVKRHITNRGEDPNYSESPQTAIVSLKTDRQTPYVTYRDVLDEIRMAYNDVQDYVARSSFGAPNYAAYRAQLDGRDDLVRQEIPLKISVAVPERGGS